MKNIINLGHIFNKQIPQITSRLLKLNHHQIIRYSDIKYLSSVPHIINYDYIKRLEFCNNYQVMTIDEYEKIIDHLFKNYYEKYTKSDVLNYLIKNCKIHGDDILLKAVCKKIAFNIDEPTFKLIPQKIEILCEEIIKIKPDYFIYMPQTLNLCELSVKKNPKNIYWVKKEVQTYEMALLSVNVCGLYLEYIRDDLIDRNLISIAIKNNGKAIKFVSNNSNLEREDWIIAIKSNPYSIIYSKNIDNDLYLLAIKTNPKILQIIDDEIKTEEMCILAIENCKIEELRTIVSYIQIITPKIKDLILKKNHLLKTYLKNK